MDSAKFTNELQGSSSQDLQVPVSSTVFSETHSPKEIQIPIIQVSLSNQGSSPVLTVHPALEIITDSSSNANQISSAIIQQRFGSGVLSHQPASSSIVSTPSLKNLLVKNVNRTLAEDGSTVSVLQPALSSPEKTSWVGSSVIDKPEQLQSQVRIGQQGFEVNQDQLRIQQVGLSADNIDVPWKPMATDITECIVNPEQCTTTTVINVDRISSTSIVLQKAQEDFSVIAEDSPTIHEESLPIDAVIETIEEYVDNAESQPNGQPGKALLMTELGSAGGIVQQNTDWNIDGNTAFDMHIKRHSDNVIAKIGFNQPQVVDSAYNRKFTVTSKGLAAPSQISESLFQAIQTHAKTSLTGRYQDDTQVLRSDVNSWESQNFPLNSDPTNIFRVNYIDGKRHTAIQKKSKDTSEGVEGPNEQPISRVQSTEQPLHIQNEMHRLGLHVHIDKVQDSEGAKLEDLDKERHQCTSETAEAKNIVATDDHNNYVMFGKSAENIESSSSKHCTANMSQEKNDSVVQGDTDVGRHAGLITDTPVNDAAFCNKLLSLTSSVSDGQPKLTPVLAENDKETLTRTCEPGVDTTNLFRREIARIVILPNQVSGKTELTVKGPDDGKSGAMKKKALLVPIRNISRVKQTEADSTSVHIEKECTSKTQNVDVVCQESLDKEQMEKSVVALKPLNTIIECELSVLQRPKKITRYFKEKAKKQETKQQCVRKEKKAVNQQSQLDQEVSAEKEDKVPFVKDDTNPTQVKIHQNHAELLEGKRSKAFTCKQCGRGFSHLGDFNSHLKAHKDGMPFTCNVCGVGFRKSGHLINHSRRHTGEKPFACTLCNNAFGQLGTLKRHMRIHTGEKPYECPTCKKRFSQLSYMKVHRRSHTGERPFKCDVCDHSFLQSGDLKKHKLRKHNAKKELSCPHCPKKFGDKVDIKRHIKTHDGKLVCKACDKKFDNVDSAKIHKQLFHSKGKAKELPHHCAVCDIGFKLKTDLRSHMANCHPTDTKKEKITSRGKGKKGGKKRKKNKSEVEDNDSDLEEDRNNMQEVETTATKSDENDEQKDQGEEAEIESAIRGSRKRKASQQHKFLTAKLDRPKRSRRAKEY
ncbi:uncharacterized protein LOC132548867 [Ylistrum balloti]|uniref:uncharacterized protein LOC132548867 n=1 Tax=Ylistrum balloti TaxID=509963 RepID=UPI002905D142|nr:uncharacterized protein LOC132548867 [Ylistrum balloti]